MTGPLVSVVIPTWNGAGTIAETIESALAQTWRRREVIVADDGSTDATPAVVARFGDAVRYVRLDRAPGRHAGAARNAGIRAGRGDFVALLDHDDLWAPGKLERQLAVAALRPESGLIACDGVEFEGATPLGPHLLHGALLERTRAAPDGIATGWFYRALVARGLIACPAQTLIPRPVVDKVGPLTERAGENSDADYYIRIARLYPVTAHRDALVRRRYLPDSRSGPRARRRFEVGLMRLRVLCRHARECAPEDRAYVRRTIRRHVRWRALQTWRERERAYAVGVLDELARLAPHDPFVRLHRAARRWLPA
jgi:glycosyltransferase involved in cell wall biosynthesis